MALTNTMRSALLHAVCHLKDNLMLQLKTIITLHQGVQHTCLCKSDNIYASCIYTSIPFLGYVPNKNSPRKLCIFWGAQMFSPPSDSTQNLDTLKSAHFQVHQAKSSCHQNLEVAPSAKQKKNKKVMAKWRQTSGTGTSGRSSLRFFIVTLAPICPLESKTSKTLKQEPYSPVSVKSSSDEGETDYKNSGQRSTRAEVALDFRSTTELESHYK